MSQSPPKTKPPRSDRSSETALPHGTIGCYVNHRCNCVDCKAAWTKYTQDLKQRRKQRLQQGEVQIQHGRATSYSNWGCRCTPCTSAWATQSRDKRHQDNGNDPDE